MRSVALLLTLWIATGCTKKQEAAGPVDPATAAANLVEDGRARFNQHCTACHSPNPKLDGPVGPAVFGASLELLEARIVKAEYPAGYTPKRTTRQMVALPFLKDDIPALHAYINSVQ